MSIELDPKTLTLKREAALKEREEAEAYARWQGLTAAMNMWGVY